MDNKIREKRGAYVNQFLEGVNRIPQRIRYVG